MKHLLFSTTIKPVSVNRRTVPGQHGKLITSPDYRNTKADMNLVFRNQYRGKPLSGKLSIFLSCGWKNFDIDGWVKIVLDSLEGIAYESDKQIRFMQIKMCEDKKITIELIDFETLEKLK